ncbi:MAG: PLDc N-terminal domain-containing protein [Bacteroidales bacterium]|nr:PLDc N-terminal domain-containing protein [Bacteroidales bacterium]
MINPLFLLIILNFIFVIVAIKSILDSNKTPTEKFIWIIIVIILGLIGVGIYYYLKKSDEQEKIN